MISIFLFGFLKYKPVIPDSVIDGLTMDIKKKKLVKSANRFSAVADFFFFVLPSSIE